MITDNLLDMAPLVDPRFKTNYIKEEKIDTIKARAMTEMLKREEPQKQEQREETQKQELREELLQLHLHLHRKEAEDDTG